MNKIVKVKEFKEKITKNVEILNSSAFKKIITLYTKEDLKLYKKINSQLRFGLQDVFLLSAQLIGNKISNALI
jgi:hypothetical protein